MRQGSMKQQTRINNRWISSSSVYETNINGFGMQESSMNAYLSKGGTDSNPMLVISQID